MIQYIAWVNADSHPEIATFANGCETMDHQLFLNWRFMFIFCSFRLLGYGTHVPEGTREFHREDEDELIAVFRSIILPKKTRESSRPQSDTLEERMILRILLTGKSAPETLIMQRLFG